MAVTTAFGAFETIIRENLGSGVLDLQLPEVDDPALPMIATMQPLGLGGRTDDNSGTWQARRKIKLSRGGLTEPGSFGGNTVTSMGDNSDLPIAMQATATAPDPEQVPRTQYITLKTNLKRINGNVTADMQQIIADLIGDDLEEIAVGHIEDAAHHVRKDMLGWFYSDGTGMLAQADGTYSVDTTAGGVAVGLKAGTFNRFEKSQRYVFYTGSGFVAGTTTVRKGGVARCVKIDDNARTVYFQMEAGEATASLVDGDIIMKNKSMTNGAAGVSKVHTGIEAMFKETGAFFGLSDITDYPELISYVEGDEDNLVQPEPIQIAAMLDRLSNAGIEPPELLISETAIMTQYGFLEKAGFAHYVVPNRMPTPDGGVSTPIFSHGDKVFPWRASNFIRPGMIWGAAPSTILKFQPGGSDTIRWWVSRGPSAGIPSIFVPVTDGTQMTELYQAPFETHLEFLPIKPKRNIRRLGFISTLTA